MFKQGEDKMTLEQLECVQGKEIKKEMKDISWFLLWELNELSRKEILRRKNEEEKSRND